MSHRYRPRVTLEASVLRQNCRQRKQRLIEWFTPPDHISQRSCDHLTLDHAHQDAVLAPDQTSNRGGAQPRGQEAVRGAGGAATLHMSQFSHTQLKPQALAVLVKIAFQLIGGPASVFRDDDDSVRLATVIGSLHINGQGLGVSFDLRNDDRFRPAGDLRPGPSSHSRGP